MIIKEALRMFTYASKKNNDVQNSSRQKLNDATKCWLEEFTAIL